MKYTINSLTIFLLQYFITNYFSLIGATSDLEIFNAPLPNDAGDWELYDPNENVRPSVEIDVPLRFEIKPTPVALGMARSEFYNQREDDYLRVNRLEIRPDNAIPNMDMTSFRHIIQKRQDDGTLPEGSGDIECSTLSQPLNGQMSSTNCATQINGCVLTFSCNEGYSLDGPSELTCMDDGTWSPSNNPPECVQNVCPNLSNPANGAVNYPCRFDGCIAQYNCNDGYVINGNTAVSTCRSSGNWVGNAPTCVLRDCGDPNIRSGSFSGSTTFGSTITITCDDNYVLQGSSNQATCQADGNWSQLPSCAYDCGVPNVQNAQHSYTCTTENCEATVTCNDGYTLDGNTQITCNDEVGWLYLPYCNREESSATARTAEAVDVSITMELSSEPEILYLYQFIEQLLENYYRQVMRAVNAYADVVILIIAPLPSHALPRRQKRQEQSELSQLIQVNYSVIVINDDPSYGRFSTAQANLVRNQTLPILGRDVPVNRTSLFGFTYLRNETAGFDRLQDVSCQIYEYSINGCPEGTVCRTFDSEIITRCVTIDDDDDDEKDDDFALKVGLGVGIPMFLLLCALLGCCCYWIVLARRRRRKRRRKRRYIREYETSSSATMSGFSPSRIPVAMDTVGRRGPLYGSQFPELWDPSESVVEVHEESPQPYRRSSYPYVVSVGHEEERQPYTSNFSWDFMYHYVDNDVPFSLPRPRL